MIREYRSEMVRLLRPRMLLVWFGLMAMFAIMVNTIMFSTASSGNAIPAGAPGVAFPDLATLASGKGLVAGLSAASSMFGIVTLSFWAMSVATDYSSGLIRILVATQPRRWRLLAGKIGALLTMTALATLVAAVVNVMAAMPSAQAAGIDTATWSDGAAGTVASALVNTFLTMAVWGAIGLALAVLSRSSAVAISVGAGYVLVVESMIARISSSTSDRLLGSTLTALATGGNATMPYSSAAWLGAAYAAVAIAIATVVVTKRDITD
jgi:ABC-2 type transport system permease protein